MTTQVQICNLALAKLGDVASVSSISPPDGSMQANYCALFYPQAVSVLLTKHNWSFATKTIGPASSPALTVDATNTNPAWAYSYSTLPADLFQVIECYDAGSVGQQLQNSPYYPGNTFYPGPYSVNYLVEYAYEGGVLYANDSNVVLVYLSNAGVSSTSGFTPLFVEALAVLLASYLAGPILKGDVGAAASQKFMQLFAMALKMAVEDDGDNRRVSTRFVPGGIRARV